MLRNAVGLLVLAVSLAGCSTSKSSEGPPLQAAPVTIPPHDFLPRPTHSDLVYDVSVHALWMTTNMREERDNPPTFVVGFDPQLQYMGVVSACLADYKYIYIRMAVSSDIRLRTMHVFYVLDDGQLAMGDGRSVRMDLYPDGATHDYGIPVADIPVSTGARIKGIRFDPVDAGSARGPNLVKISQFRFISNGKRSSACR